MYEETVYLFVYPAVLYAEWLCQKYLPATLYYADGQTASMLLKATPPEGKFVVAKANEQAKKEKIASELLTKIIFEVDEHDPVTYEQHSLDLAGRIKDKQ